MVLHAKHLRDPDHSVLQPLALQSPPFAATRTKSGSSASSVGSDVTRCSSTCSAISLTSFGSDRSRHASVPTQKAHNNSNRVSLAPCSRLRHGDLPFKSGWLGLRVSSGMFKKPVDRYVELAGAYIVFAASPNTDIMASCYQIYKASVTTDSMSSTSFRINVKTEAGERLVLTAENGPDYEDWLYVLKRAATRHINDHYRCDEVIGPAVLGRVAGARDIANGDVVSVRMTTKADMADDLVALARRECLNLVSCPPHPAIARVVDMYETATTIYCVTEHVPPQNSIRQIVRGHRPFSERDTSFIVQSLLRTLVHLHDNNMYHRCCTADSVHLVDPTLPERGIKLTSFELAISEHDSPRDHVSLLHVIQHRGLDQPVSTSMAPFVAPEVLRGDIGSFSQDSWAAGILLHYMLVAATPFDGPNQTAEDALLISAKAVGMPSFRGIMWDGISRDAMDLCARLLHADPRRRLSPRNALRHRWFRFNE